ncbi:MAG: ABC transporter permease [Lachnospiraceae bacterium]|nr:ABC transporter permease [Lachnospiraceae bacterium]MBR4145439.1 ABC transporter permease [Lachnospiraceae bacterium]
MNGMSIIIKKELKRVFGDKKLVFSMFILPAIIMIALYGIMGFMIGKMNSDIEENVNKVYVVNSDDRMKNAITASGFDKTNDITYLNEADFRAKEQDIRDEVLNGDAQLVVYMDKDFNQKFTSYTDSSSPVPQIKLSYNTTENYSQNTYGMFATGVLEIYRTGLLQERVGSLDVLNVFDLEDDIIEKEEKANSRFISMMLPYMIVIMLFAGAMSVGVDAMAGEKERGTLASMLLSPVNRTAIAGGKIIAMMILSGLSAIVYVVSMMIAMPVMSAMGGGESEMAGGFGGLSLSLVEGLQLAAIMLALVFLFVAVISFMAIRAKDTKAASSLISPIYIVVMVAGMLTMFMSGKEVPITRYFIPVYGNAVAIKDICNGELVTSNFLASLAGTVIIAILLTIGIAKAFDDEKVMFNA